MSIRVNEVCASKRKEKNRNEKKMAEAATTTTTTTTTKMVIILRLVRRWYSFNRWDNSSNMCFCWHQSRFFFPPHIFSSPCFSTFGAVQSFVLSANFLAPGLPLRYKQYPKQRKNDDEEKFFFCNKLEW